MATLGEQFRGDARLIEAKKLIKEALQDHQKKITGIKPAQDDLSLSYDHMIKELSQNRGGALFYRYIGSGFGQGPFVELADGSIKYDFITGIGVHYFGHAHEELVLAAVEGSLENTVMQGHLQQNVSSHRLIELLLKHANSQRPKTMDHLFLTSSGAMANENALKLAFQKRFPAQRVLAFNKCFSGRTLGLSWVTDKAAYRQGLPKTIDVDYLPFFDEKNPEASTAEALAVLKKYLYRYPKQYAALLFEPIQGEGGSWAGDRHFFRELLSLAKNEGISIISDEVQAFARTESLYAFQYYGLDDLVDLVTIGKMSQVCATLFNEQHKPGPGLVSQTFTSSSVAINVSYRIISKLVEEGYLGPQGKISKLGHYFRNRLEQLKHQYPHKVDGPFGVGVMAAMTVFGGDEKKSTEFVKTLFNNGVMSFTAGSSPTRVRFLMPVGAVKEQHIDEVIQLIEKTLQSIDAQ